MGKGGFGDTIAALSSGRTPAAISVIRCSGTRAFEVAESLAGPLPRPRHASLRRLTDPRTGLVLDEGLLVLFPGPDTATGENIAEFQCHGGRATVDAVLAAIVAHSDCRLAEPGEFTRRALTNGRIDLTEAEGLADLLAAETEVQRRSAMTRAGGAFRLRLEEWRDAILALSARAEVAIDYADEDDGASVPDLAPAIAELRGRMLPLLEAPPVEPLRDGVRVVIGGPPNAGKSSLINILTQSERAIVTPIAGTTRDVIEVPVSLGGIPFVFVDTAGLHDSDDFVEGIGIRRAQAELERADIILWMGDADSAPAEAIQLSGKADIEPVGPGLPISATTGQGLEVLTTELGRRAAALLPRGDELALDRRHRELLRQACDALGRADGLGDPVLVAEELRSARTAIDAISGRAGVDDLLDALFGRFCLGK